MRITLKLSICLTFIYKHCCCESVYLSHANILIIKYQSAYLSQICLFFINSSQSCILNDFIISIKETIVDDAVSSQLNLRVKTSYAPLQLDGMICRSISIFRWDDMNANIYKEIKFHVKKSNYKNFFFNMAQKRS